MTRSKERQMRVGTSPASCTSSVLTVRDYVKAIFGQVGVSKPAAEAPDASTVASPLGSRRRAGP